MTADLTAFVKTPTLIVESQAPLPTRYGLFTVYVFRAPDEVGIEHVAIVSGDVRGKSDVAVRLHSECLTSEIIGSLKCDCREQLEAALEHIGQETGVVLYLRQEGRGIGLANKLRAYALQAEGADTVDANRALGLPDDTRRYHQSAAMLRWLGVQSVRLMTNNPDKAEGLTSFGTKVSGRIPVLIRPNVHSLRYLQVKRDRMKHQLPKRLQTTAIDAE
ncbi:MAG: GTP cyclohydrolase II [Deltaproteobacteria bacterium]|nr:GTP cyclohydrolase II [Deltaproteobacteria bacterium]